VYNDPESIEPDGYRFAICAKIKSAVALNDFGVVTKEIPGGRCAVVRHRGSDDQLGLIVNYLYCNWINQNREELRNFPLFFERIKLFPDVPEHEAKTDIYLPIK
jgi:AraC family transcriptional regulator